MSATTNASGSVAPTMPMIPGSPSKVMKLCEHLQRDVSRQHIGEQIDAVRNRAREER